MPLENSPNTTFNEQQPAQPVRTLEALLSLYAKGHRNFSGSDLRGATVNIIDEKVKSLDLSGIILRESNLTAIVLAKPGGLKVDLTGSDFSNCNLQGANLSDCRLDQCNFSNSDLRRANLDACSCRGSDFVQALLQNISIYSHNTDFTASNFTKANLSNSYLTGTFVYTNFCGANFYKSTFKSLDAKGADFADANLQDVQLPTPTMVDIRYSYYNQKTKFSKTFDPIAMGMELIKDVID